MIYIFRIYQWIIAAPILVIATALTAITTFIGASVGNPDFWGYYPPKLWSRLVCILLGIRVKVEGRNNIDSKTSYVFVANHQGAFDIWAIYGYLNHNFKWLMKIGLEKIFLVGPACRKAGHVFVDDSNLKGIKQTISTAEKRLTNGMSLVIFPEGSRSWDGKMIPFKRGAFILAAEFRLPIVPVTIDGSLKAMPRTTYNVTPCTITLTIHSPIYPTDKGFDTKNLINQCYETINSKLNQSL